MVYGLKRASRPSNEAPSPKTWLSREVERSEAKASQGVFSDSSDGSSSPRSPDGDGDGDGRSSAGASRVTSRRPSAEPGGSSRRPSAEGQWVHRPSEERSEPRSEPRSRKASAEGGSAEPVVMRRPVGCVLRSSRDEPVVMRRLRMPSAERLARSRRPSAEGGAACSAEGEDAELEAKGVQQRAPRSRAGLTEDGHQVGLSSLSDAPWASSEYTVAEGGRTGGAVRGSRRASADEEAPPVGPRMKRRLNLDKYVLKGSTL